MKVKTFSQYERCTLWALCFVVAVTLLSGCVVSKPRHVISLSDATSREGTLKDIDGMLAYTMNYTHEKTDAGDGLGTLRVAGVIQPNQPLNSINIEVYFIDAQGTITGKQSLFTTMSGWGYHTKYRAKESTFSEEIIIPKGTESLGFSVYTHDRPQRPGRGGK